ncbi:MAG: hypothetical protein MZV64_58350 [Ignavibacteriales bacterium]|nr:hypothetical protein [Ignavibacteriales bacterium]
MRLIKKAKILQSGFRQDERKIPVSVKFDIIVGSGEAELISYKNLIRSVRLKEIDENFRVILIQYKEKGSVSGVPSFFIRTNKCNLRCMFASGNLCDTPCTSWTPGDSK